MKSLIPLAFLAHSGLAQADSESLCLSNPNHYGEQVEAVDLLSSLERSEGKATDFSLRDKELSFLCGGIQASIELTTSPSLVQQLSPIIENESWEVKNEVPYEKNLQEFVEFARSVQDQCQQTLKNER